MGVQDKDRFREDRGRKEAMRGNGSKTPTRHAQPNNSKIQSQEDVLKVLGEALLKLAAMLVIVCLIVAAFCLLIALSGIRF